MQSAILWPVISSQDIQALLADYDQDQLTIGVLGGHSALDVCAGAKKHGFRTVAVCQEGREKTYQKYLKRRAAENRAGAELGCIDEVIVVPKFGDVVDSDVQERLRKMNTVFIHNRYFWVYCDFEKVEKDFRVPIFGTRTLLKKEERDQEKNQYYLLQKAGIRTPIIFERPEDIDRHVLVKVNEATRGYERAFFVVKDFDHYKEVVERGLAAGDFTEVAIKDAVIEEFIVGAHVNFNFFYSPFAGEVELMGTDMRRQTNLDGLLRMPAWDQIQLHKKGFDVKMIETGHVAVTVKESLLEKIYDMGERFVAATQKEHAPGIIGPFALQGAVVAEEGKEDIVIFDVSMRIPGSPGTASTPYSGYLYGHPISFGERIAMEIAEGVKQGKLAELVT